MDALGVSLGAHQKSNEETGETVMEESPWTRLLVRELHDEAAARVH